MVLPRRIDAPLLGHREQADIASAARLLGAISAGSSPDHVFDALRVCAPIVGGMIGVMGSSPEGSSMAHVVRLPTGVLEGWATTPLAHLHRMMAPLLPAGPGAVISDRSAITGAFREELELLRIMDGAGLGESAGYKVSTGTTPWGRPEHRFLTLALEGGEVFTRRTCQIFQQLAPAVSAAVARMAVPLLAREPIFAQVVAERRIGYLCLSRSGSIVELNERAHELVFRYLTPARIEPGRGCLTRFSEKALLETSGGRPWRLSQPGLRASAELTAHRLAKETHAVGEDLTLLMMSELGPPSGLPTLAEVGLSTRQVEVAELLATTDLTYKEIAARLGIAEGTVRKHIEKIYRALGVRSRAGLLFRPT